MKTKIYTIFDTKVGAYNFPFTMRSDGEALRAFSDMANDPKSRIGAHPEDYCLFAVGEFDDLRGIVTPLVPHETLGKAVEFVWRGGPVDEPEQLDLVDFPFELDEREAI